MEYDRLRKLMVDQQLIARGIKDKKVLDVFLKIPRHKFIPEEERDSAYCDFPLAIGQNQTISQPYIVALMTELLELSGNEKVLEIGTGSGYQTAILAELTARVYSIERFDLLAKNAESTLGEEGYKNINIRVGDGTLGWTEESPFNRIIITAASRRIPLPLIEQLSEGGSIVMPLGETFSQTLIVAKKINNKIQTRDVCGCVFVPLVGKYGYKTSFSI